MKIYHKDDSLKNNGLNKDKIQEVLADKKNLAYLCAFACLCLDYFSLHESIFDSLFKAMFLGKNKDFLRPYCLEIFLSSIRVRFCDDISVPCYFKNKKISKSSFPKFLFYWLDRCSSEDKILTDQIKDDYIKFVLDGLNKKYGIIEVLLKIIG